jgi:hypothetical protein
MELNIITHHKCAATQCQYVTDVLWERLSMVPSVKGEGSSRSTISKIVSAGVNIEPIFSRESDGQPAEGAARLPGYIKPALHWLHWLASICTSPIPPSAPNTLFYQIMPPRGTSPEAGRGRGGRGGGRGGRGGRGGFHGGSRGGFRGGDDRGSGRGRSRGDRGAGRSSGSGGSRGRGHGTGGPSGATPSYGPQLTGHREALPPQLPVDHTKAIGEKRTSYGNAAERRVWVTTNHVAFECDQGTIYHYDGMHISPFLKACDLQVLLVYNRDAVGEYI